MVLRPEKEDEARAVFTKWDLDFALVGETIPEDRFLVMHGGEVKVDLPLKTLSGSAPEYDRPQSTPPAPKPLGDIPKMETDKALLGLLGSANYGSRRWVWEQYDHMVMADTVVRPGSDAAVIRIHGTDRALAFTSDVTPRYCFANPFEGGKQAVAETYRNLSATGAKPLACTDNLNFGNPEKPEIMGQFVNAVRGIGEACEALGTPIVSGNVSLYNETDGAAILPTPTIGAVGLLESLNDIIPAAPGSGEVLVLIGESRGHLGQSAWLAELFDRAEGDAPPVDLAAERRAGELVRALKAGGHITAAHDLADGGLALAAAEMALRGNVGVSIEGDSTLPASAWFFGEDQGRYLLACAPGSLDALLGFAKDAGVPARKVGETGGDAISLAGSKITLDVARDAYEGALPGVMQGQG